MSCRRMANCLTFSIILSLCCLQALAELQEHGPFQEGVSETLTCSGRTSPGNRYVYWMATRFNQMPFNLSTCDSLDSSCEDKYAHKYHATIIDTSTGFNSSLTIHNMTSEDWYTDYQCVSERIQAWNLSKFFHEPEGLSCTAKYVSFSCEINITCITSKVYPNMFCEMIQIYNNTVITSLPNSTQVVYSRSPRRFEKYTSARCSVAIPIYKTGVYMYYVTAYAGVILSDRLPNDLKFFTTNEVNVSSLVVVEQQTTDTCPRPGTPLLFWCTAYLVSAPVKFLWSFDSAGRKTERTQKLTKISENYYRSIFEVTNPEWRNEQTVSCRVNFEADSESRFLQHTIRVTVLRLGHPYFTYGDNRVTANELRLKKDAVSNTFMCRIQDHESTVHDGKQDEMSLRVSCYSKDEKYIPLDTVNEGYSVTFTIHHNTTKRGFCSCSVYHSYPGFKCDTSVVNFTFSMPSVATKEDPGLMYSIFYIVAGTTGIIFLIFIIGICLFLRNNWQELYTYVYFHYSEAATIDDNILSRHNEPADCFTSGRSSSCHDKAQAFENRPQYCHDNINSFQGSMPPPGVLTSFECLSDTNQNKGIPNGCNTRSYSNVVKTIIPHKVHQTHLTEHEMTSSKDTPADVRLLPHRPPPLGCSGKCTPLVRHCGAGKISKSHSSDDLSLFNHHQVALPRPCKIHTQNCVQSAYCSSMSASSYPDVDFEINRDFQASICSESSETQTSIFTRKISSRSPIDREKDVEPISSPRHKQTAQRVHAINRRHKNQFKEPRAKRKHSTAPLTGENKSLRMPTYSNVQIDLGFSTCGAEYSNIAMTSKRPREKRWYTEVSSLASTNMKTRSRCDASGSTLQSVTAATGLLGATFLTSERSQRCKQLKPKKSPVRPVDYTNVNLNPFNFTSRLHSTSSDPFQKGQVGRCRTSTSDTCVYENVQAMLPSRFHADKCTLDIA